MGEVATRFFEKNVAQLVEEKLEKNQRQEKKKASVENGGGEKKRKRRRNRRSPPSKKTLGCFAKGKERKTRLKGFFSPL